MREVRDKVGIPPPNQPRPRATNGFHDDKDSTSLRAAQVHGQLMSDEAIRRPMRLDALPSLGPVGGGGKKNKKKRGMDPL